MMILLCLYADETETMILAELTHYDRANSIRANPDKTQVIDFHLRNKEAKRWLKIKWNNSDLENSAYPKYLGVTLDRTLSYKENIHNTNMKVATRNNLLRKLENSKWGTNAGTIRTKHLLYATWPPNMQLQYGRDRNT